mgnify:FL=1
MKKVTLILISLLLCLCLVGCDDNHDDDVDHDSDDAVEVKNTITPLEDKKITGYNSYDIVPYKLNVDDVTNITLRRNFYENGEWTSEDWVIMNEDWIARDEEDSESFIFGIGVDTHPDLDIDNIPTTLIYYQFDDDLKVETKVTGSKPISLKGMTVVSTAWLPDDRNVVDGEELVVFAMFGSNGDMLLAPGGYVFDENYKNKGDRVYDKAIVITLIVTYKG